MESKFYSQEEEIKVRGRIKLVSMIAGIVFLLGIGISLLFYFLANRSNYVVYEVLLCIFFSLFLCVLFFIGTYYLAPLIGKLSLIKEIRKVSISTYQIESFEIEDISIFVHEVEFVTFKIVSEGKTKSFYIEKRLIPCIENKKIVEARIQNRYVTSIKYE